MDAVAQDHRDLVFAGVAEQAARVRDGHVTPRELVDASLARIAELDGALNAFRVVFADAARQAAEAALDLPSDLPLRGVPIAVKDDVAVAGEPLVWGSGAHGGPEPQDGGLVRTLRAAGAIVIGITRTPELTIWPFTETAHGGATRNPWDVSRTPGGSSGGSGAAVAAGLVAGATASDGGGSIRIPAACCGLFGLKPQGGRLPWDTGEAWNGLAVPGFLTRSVADSALLYEVATGLPWAAAAGRDPGRLRIAVSFGVPPGTIVPLSADRRAAVLETAELLRRLGHEVVERDPDFPLAAGASFLTRFFAGVYEASGKLPHPERYERRTRSLCRIGRAAVPVLGRALAARDGHAARMNAIFDDVDVVLTPVLGGPPIPVGRFEGRGALRTVEGSARWIGYCPAWNHAGNPAASVPAGRDAAGLPLAVQLVGPPSGEERLLSLSAQIEGARSWLGDRPVVS